MRPLVIGMNGYSNLAGAASVSPPPFDAPKRAERRLPSFSSRWPALQVQVCAQVRDSPHRHNVALGVCRRRRLRPSGSTRTDVGTRRRPLFMDCDHQILKACVVTCATGNGSNLFALPFRGNEVASVVSLPSLLRIERAPRMRMRD